MLDGMPKASGTSADHGAVVVGADLTTADLLGRAGACAAAVDKRPQLSAVRQACSQSIQTSSIPAIDPGDLLDPSLAAGGVRLRTRFCTPRRTIGPAPERATHPINLRPEGPGPRAPRAGANAPGVDRIEGRTTDLPLRPAGARRLHGHAFFIHQFAGGPHLRAPERLILSDTAAGPALALDGYVGRQIGPARNLARALPRAPALIPQLAIEGPTERARWRTADTRRRPAT